VIEDPFWIGHDYVKERKENTAYHYIIGYVDGVNRKDPPSYYLSTEKTYYIAKAYLEGYKKGKEKPYRKFSISYKEHKDWQKKILSN
jgi:hypothetical protein